MMEEVAAPTVHVPVLLEAVLAQLPQDLTDKKVVDCTLGGGGYTQAFLERGAVVLALDKDPVAIQRAKDTLLPQFSKLNVFEGSFAELETALEEAGWAVADYIVADLGLSSDQLDSDKRGFSFHTSAPLDMRMGQQGLTAAEVLNTWDEQALFVMFKAYADEPKARPLARLVVSRRKEAPFVTTDDFMAAIEEIYPPNPTLKRRHPAQRLFQALRMVVNTEEQDLAALLAVAPKQVAAGGQVLIVTFHSLEDRMVKQAFRALCQPQRDTIGREVAVADFETPVRKVGPTDAEIEANPRARSATLRVLQRREKACG